MENSALPFFYTVMSYRFAFEPFIAEPQKFPDVVLFYDDEVIIIRDGFPKSVRHWLVIPRDKEISRLDPVLALKNVKNYTMLKPYVDKAKSMIIKELQAEYNGDWLTFVKCGVHAIPSLANLHIHVILQDFNSNRMKHKKHYNSFTTPFFIPFESFDPAISKTVQCTSSYKRRKLEHLMRTKSPDGYGSASDSDLELPNEATQVEESPKEGYSSTLINNNNPAPVTELPHAQGTARIGSKAFLALQSSELEQIIKDSPMRCTYCKKSFKNNFQALKKHLKDEFISAYAAPQ